MFYIRTLFHVADDTKNSFFIISIAFIVDGDLIHHCKHSEEYVIGFHNFNYRWHIKLTAQYFSRLDIPVPKINFLCNQLLCQWC